MVQALTPTDYLVMFGAGAIASGVNSVAGGGSLVSYPTLTLGLHIPDRIANATNAVGLFPGSFAGGVGFLNQIERTKHHLKTLWLPTVIGSFVGAWLLLVTDNNTFKAIVPFLILLASVLLAVQPKIKKALSAKGHHAVLPKWAGILLQIPVAIYGGFFGAGMGIMMLATFSLTMEGDIHELNAVKNWLGSLINLACSLVFIAKGLVLVPHAYPLVLGSLVGGYVASRVSQKVNADKLRTAIAIYGFGMTAYYLWRTFGS